MEILNPEANSSQKKDFVKFAYFDSQFLVVLPIQMKRTKESIDWKLI